jgi:hypothetical protein
VVTTPQGIYFQNLPTLGPLPSVKINTKYYLKINKNPMILDKYYHRNRVEKGRGLFPKKN